MKTYQAVLFDLDGTINDSGPGIIASVRYAIDKAGYPPLPEETLRRFVGPSLVSSFQSFCGMPEETAWQAVEYYRERYLAGEMYNLAFYPGIPDLLHALDASSLRAAVVSSKPHAAVETILEHFDLRRHFACVVGPEPDDPSNDKSVLIGSALRRLELKPEEVVMVGDTKYDVIGAAQAGADSIGVTYGYGTPEELRENHATYLADNVQRVAEILGLKI